MSLSRMDFDLLTAIERDGLSALSTAGSSQTEALKIRNLIDDNGLTSEGYAELEPYRVRRAVFLAAGFGVRMVPVTLDTPKPLVTVNGIRLIETLLDAVVAVGIEEIWIVRGYKGEQFDLLLEKYPQIRFIENEAYDTANNILSACLARDYLKNAYVFESDLFLKNSSLITKYQYESNYLGVPTSHTDDWCFLADEELTIHSIQRGGDNCYHMFGISYMDGETGSRLSEDIPELYENNQECRSHFWDEVALVYCKDKYKIKVRPCSFEDVLELDTLDELIAEDASYSRYKSQQNT